MRGRGEEREGKEKNRKTWNWSSVVSNLFSALRRWRCAKRLIVTFFLYRIRIEIVSRTWSYSGFICCIKFIRSFKYFSNQDELSRRGMELWAVAGCHQKKCALSTTATSLQGRHVPHQPTHQRNQKQCKGRPNKFVKLSQSSVRRRKWLKKWASEKQGGHPNRRRFDEDPELELARIMLATMGLGTFIWTHWKRVTWDYEVS